MSGAQITHSPDDQLPPGPGKGPWWVVVRVYWNDRRLRETLFWDGGEQRWAKWRATVFHSEEEAERAAFLAACFGGREGFVGKVEILEREAVAFLVHGFASSRKRVPGEWPPGQHAYGDHD